MINYIHKERLAQTFVDLCEISSPSRREKNVADHIREIFTSLGANSIVEDDSAGNTGSESGNLIIRFQGTRPDMDGVFFSCHMDTVQPGEGVQVEREENIFTSRGDTILGGDDKSGIAAIIEMMTVIVENKLEHGLIEIILTTCEEIGLLGAKNINRSLITASYGYALDSSGIDTVITGAPAANKFKIEVTGVAAHAGLHPEQGISAIQVAARAITGINLGRLDAESTANFGIIHGGVATNIIPEHVIIEGEVRSHSPEKLERYSKDIETVFTRTVNEWQNASPENTLKPELRIEALSEYPAMSLPMDSKVIKRVRTAGEKIGKNMKFVISGGGSDANIFNGFGLSTAIVSTGMNKVHTTDEQLDLNDLVSLTELICAVAVES